MFSFSYVAKKSQILRFKLKIRTLTQELKIHYIDPVILFKLRRAF